MGPGVPTHPPISFLSIPATVLPMLKRPLLRMFMATCRERGSSAGQPGGLAGETEGPGGTARESLVHFGQRLSRPQECPEETSALGREAQAPPLKTRLSSLRCSQPSVQSAQKGRGRPPCLRAKGAGAETSWASASSASLSWRASASGPL